jgi:hypothetical protein
LIINTLRLRKLAEYEYRCNWKAFCHNEGMIIKKDFNHIAQAIALANANGNAVSDKFASLNADLLGQKLAEDFTVEHGTQHASDREIEQEFVSLDAVESDKDDIDEDDEESTDMSCVSEAFSDLFDTIECWESYNQKKHKIMFILQSIPFASKSGWVNETIPLIKRHAHALLEARKANATGTRRFRIIRLSDGFATHG